MILDGLRCSEDRKSHSLYGLHQVSFKSLGLLDQPRSLLSVLGDTDRPMEGNHRGLSELLGLVPTLDPRLVRLVKGMITDVRNKSEPVKS